jgi:transcriptional regulator with XRE-family HTH domain
VTSLAGPFGTKLRQWRTHRGLSQLSLAARVGSTSRHISFLETGRSRPSRQMVLRLAETLDIGRRDANELLHAAGLPAAYPTGELGDTGLAPYRGALERMLAAHEPYPGMVLDGHWTVVAANPSARRLFGPTLVGCNFARNALTDPAAQAAVVNWAEVGWAGLERLRRHQQRHPFDHVLQDLVAHAETALTDVPRPPETEKQVLVCPRFRVGDEIIRTVAMVARFDHPAETTLDELRVELMYPADDTAERYFRSQAAGKNLGRDVENDGAGSD